MKMAFSGFEPCSSESVSESVLPGTNTDIDPDADFSVFMSLFSDQGNLRVSGLNARLDELRLKSAIEVRKAAG